MGKKNIKYIDLDGVRLPFRFTMGQFSGWLNRKDIPFSEMGSYLAQDPFNHLYEIVVEGLNRGAKADKLDRKFKVDDIDDIVGNDMQVYNDLMDFVSINLFGQTEEELKAAKQEAAQVMQP